MRRHVPHRTNEKNTAPHAAAVRRPPGRAGGGRWWYERAHGHAAHPGGGALLHDPHGWAGHGGPVLPSVQPLRLLRRRVGAAAASCKGIKKKALQSLPTDERIRRSSRAARRCVCSRPGTDDPPPTPPPITPIVAMFLVRWERGTGTRDESRWLKKIGYNEGIHLSNEIFIAGTRSNPFGYDEPGTVPWIEERSS